MQHVSPLPISIALLSGAVLAMTPLGGRAAAADHPLAQVQKIYRLPDPDFSVFHDKQRRRQFYTPRIVRLIITKEACFRTKFKMDELDFNYIVPGQDYDIRELRLSLRELHESTAIVRVEYSGPGTSGRLDYYFENDSGRWLIDDVIVAPDDTLAKSLSAPC